MELSDVELRTLSGEESSLGTYRGKALLIVNVASQCGLTPQYASLQNLQKRLGKKGFTVLGFPCNQFGAQEPGEAGEIAAFCSREYGVSFPLFEKIDVNGPARHPLYGELTAFPDADGRAGDVDWNFEKFLVSPEMEVVARYRPITEPEGGVIVNDIKSVLRADPPAD